MDSKTSWQLKITPDMSVLYRYYGLYMRVGKANSWDCQITDIYKSDYLVTKLKIKDIAKTYTGKKFSR